MTISSAWGASSASPAAKTGVRGLARAGWWLITARGVLGVGATAHVHTALTAGTVLLAASLLAVLGLILPTYLRSGSPRPAAPQPEPGTRREPARIMTSA